MYYISFYGPFSAVSLKLSLGLAVIFEIYSIKKGQLFQGDGFIVGAFIALIVNILVIFYRFVL